MSEKKKYILIASAAVVILLAATFIPMVFRGKEPVYEPPVKIPPTPTTPSTTINGLYERTENVSVERIKLIEETLFATIDMNIKGADLSASDVTIREGTYQQVVDDTVRQIYYTTFIVDIPSLKQSYRVNDYYSPLPNAVSGLRDYTTLVLCLDAEDLIYGEFNCMDKMKEVVL